MISYEKLRARQQKELNALPIGFAYNDKQHEEMIKKLGVATKDELYRGHGGYYRKVDADLINNTLERLAKELEEALKDYDFAYGAFLYEFANHEYHISREPGYVLEAIGLEYDWDNGACPELTNNPMLAAAFVRARKDFLAKVRSENY